MKKTLIISLAMISLNAFGQNPSDVICDTAPINSRFYAKLIFDEVNLFRKSKKLNELKWDSAISEDCIRHAKGICEGKWTRLGNENCADELFYRGVAKYRSYEHNAKNVIGKWKEYRKNRIALLEDMNIGAVGIDESCENIVFRISTTIENRRVRPPLYAEKLKDTDTITKENFDIKFLERTILESISRYRVRKGLKPIRWDYVMAQGCRKHSEWLVKNKKFMHAPDIESSGECIEGFGLGFKKYTYRHVADGATQIWINSPGHNAILLHRSSEEWGEIDYAGAIGICVDDSGPELGVPVRIGSDSVSYAYYTPIENPVICTFRITGNRVACADGPMSITKMDCEEDSALQKKLLSIKSKKQEEEKNRKTSEKIILWIKKIKLSL